MLETKMDVEGDKKAKIRVKKKNKTVTGWIPCNSKTLKKKEGAALPCPYCSASVAAASRALPRPRSICSMLRHIIVKRRDIS